MLASFTLSEDVESHSMQPPASEDARLCLPEGIVRGGEETWPVRGEVTWLRCSDLRGRVGDLSGLQRCNVTQTVIRLADQADLCLNLDHFGHKIV